VVRIYDRLEDVHELAETVFLTGELRIAQRLLDQPTRGVEKNGDEEAQILPSLQQLVGDRKYGWRLKQIARLTVSIYLGLEAPGNIAAALRTPDGGKTSCKKIRWG
jgi:hypothetical protein